MVRRVSVRMGKHDISMPPAVHRDGFDVLCGLEPPRPEHVVELRADLAFDLFERFFFEIVAILLQLLIDRQPWLAKISEH